MPDTVDPARIPDAAKAVRLDDPMLSQAHKFLTDFVAVGGVALVIVGQSQDGRIALTAIAPGGQVQVLGLLAKAMQIIGGQQQQVAPVQPTLLRPA